MAFFFIFLLRISDITLGFNMISLSQQLLYKPGASGLSLVFSTSETKFPEGS